MYQIYVCFIRGANDNVKNVQLNTLLFIEVWNIQTGKIVFQWTWVISSTLWVDSHCTVLEVNTLKSPMKNQSDNATEPASRDFEGPQPHQDPNDVVQFTH